MMFTFDPTVSSTVRRDSPVAAAARPTAGPLSQDLAARMHRYWQAANYLTVGQIYLQDNPLLRDPLRPEHIKPVSSDTGGRLPG